MEGKGALSKSFYKASVTLIPKPDKNSTKSNLHQFLSRTWMRNFLVVQWLKVHLPIQGTQVPLVQEDLVCHGQGSHAHVPQILKPKHPRACA